MPLSNVLSNKFVLIFLILCLVSQLRDSSLRLEADVPLFVP
jgi:hypothetical protein